MLPGEAAVPLAAFFGGKRLLAKRIITRLDRLPHFCYAEPFVGLGGVFLRRSTRATVEVINDRHDEIVNLLRVVREHPDALAAQFDFTVGARREFGRLFQIPPHTLTDIQRAARFAYLQTLSFGGQIPQQASNFATSPHRRTRFSAARLQRRIAALSRRLDRVVIEHMDWAVFLDRYDTPRTLFYLDPPYWGCESDYGRGLFRREEFGRLAQRLRDLQGRFVLSLNDRPEIRTLFGAFQVEAVPVTYTAAVTAGTPATELLISQKK